MSTETQCQKILTHLKSGDSITPIGALSEFGCFRLGARIYDLKQQGHPIQKQMIETKKGKRVAEYWLETQQ